MPITQAARKAIRQSRRRRGKNIKQADSVKNEIKSLKSLIAAKNKKGALALLPRVYKALDKAVKNHRIAKNKAARLKSQFAKAVNKL